MAYSNPNTTKRTDIFRSRPKVVITNQIFIDGKKVGITDQIFLYENYLNVQAYRK